MNTSVISFIQDLLQKQVLKRYPIPVNVVLNNGNIELKGFRIYDFNDETKIVKGMTLQEEYASVRENRKPVFAFFTLDDIKSVENSTAGYMFVDNYEQMDQLRSV